MEKMYTFAFRKTENFSREGGRVVSLFSEKKKFKNYCLTNLNKLYEQRGTQQSSDMKRIVIYLFPFMLFYACSRIDKEPEEAPKEVPQENIWDENQVFYNNNPRRERIPYNETKNVIGEPRINITREHVPSSLSAPRDGFPWVIKGDVNNGIMEVVFPNEILYLGSEYRNSHTESVGIAEVRLLSYCNGIANPFYFLCKWESNLLGQIYIYYSEDLYSKMNNETIELKRGWNFIELLYDYDNGLRLLGRISQDINVFIKDGYRWEAWYLIGTNPSL